MDANELRVQLGSLTHQESLAIEAERVESTQDTRERLRLVRIRIDRVMEELTEIDMVSKINSPQHGK